MQWNQGLRPLKEVGLGHTTKVGTITIEVLAKGEGKSNE